MRTKKDREFVFLPSPPVIGPGNEFFSIFLFSPGKKIKRLTQILEESEQFRFLRTACFANIKGSVGLILAKASECGSLYRSTGHLGLLYHYLVSFVLDVLHHS